LTDVAALVNGNLAVGVPHDPHPNKVLQFAEVLHLEFPSQLPLHGRNISSVLAGDEQVIDPNCDVNVSFGVDIKARVGARSDKADLDHERVDLLVPNRRRLFEAIKGSQQSTREVS